MNMTRLDGQNFTYFMGLTFTYFIQPYLLLPESWKFCDPKRPILSKYLLCISCGCISSYWLLLAEGAQPIKMKYTNQSASFWVLLGRGSGQWACEYALKLSRFTICIQYTYTRSTMTSLSSVSIFNKYEFVNKVGKHR